MQEEGQQQKQTPLDYLFIINQYNQPLLFKVYHASSDDLNIQLHTYASLDFLDEKLLEKGSQFLGQIYTIYNLSGQYSIYAFYTVTKMKFLAIFKERINVVLNQDKVRNFFMKIYKLYKKQLYQPFENTLEQNKFSKSFHQLLNSVVYSSTFS